MVILQHRRKSFRVTAPSLPVSTSYANTGGSGNRTSIITTAQSGSGVPFNNAASQLIDGIIAGSTAYWNSVPNGGWVSFDFGSAKVINEVKYYQGNTTPHGVWRMQGSSDNSSWNDIGSTFTLGGAPTSAQTITEMSSNTTAYRYYRFIKVSGTTSNAVYCHEFEFKISA